MKNLRLKHARAFGLPVEATLQALEKAVGWSLPLDYRRFLSTYNGGFPRPDCVEFAEHSRRTATDVHSFHGLHDGPAWASLRWHMHTYQERLPASTLPIAHDSTGNLWLLHGG